MIERLVKNTLDGDSAALTKLEDYLGGLSEFPRTLHKAWESSLQAAGTSAIADLDPRALQKKHSKFGGTNYKQAFRDLETAFDDLCQTSDEDWYEQYFKDRLALILKDSFDFD